jgi:hypothetical protein
MTRSKLEIQVLNRTGHQVGFNNYAVRFQKKKILFVLCKKINKEENPKRRSAATTPPPGQLL